MSDTYLYLIVAVFFLVSSVPIKFMTSEEYKVSNRGMYLGAMVAISLNLYFYLGLGLHDGVKRFESWHFRLTFLYPLLIFFALTVMVVIAKNILKGDTPMNKWDVNEANKFLLHEDNTFRRFVAHGFIAICYPTYFFNGMAMTGALITMIIFNGH